MIWSAISALATSIAVTVALFKDAFLQWWLRPRLRLNELDTRHDPSSRSRKPHDLGNRLEVWQLMAVANIGRGHTASNVEVLALDVTRLEGSPPEVVPGSFEVKNYGLKWSLLPTRRLGIPAGTERWIDIVFAIELPLSTKIGPRRLLCLPAKDDEWLPTNRPVVESDWLDQGHVLQADAYRVHVAVAGEGLRARHYDVDVCLMTEVAEPDLQKALKILGCRRHQRYRLDISETQTVQIGATRY
jgi:hypothetical protein